VQQDKLPSSSAAGFLPDLSSKSCLDMLKTRALAVLRPSWPCTMHAQKRQWTSCAFGGRAMSGRSSEIRSRMHIWRPQKRGPGSCVQILTHRPPNPRTG
jgi:hypothetical protein